MKLVNNETLIKICLAILISLYAFTSFDDVAANAAVHNGNIQYQTIAVSRGDSVWSIAAKYTSDKEDIRMLVSAISQVNGLNKDMAIYPGQQLKIPMRENGELELAKKANGDKKVSMDMGNSKTLRN